MSVIEQKQIYFIRHGETMCNRHFCHQGPDESLSPLGQKQVLKVANYFRDKNIDTVITSDYARAIKTAEAITKAVGVPLCEEPAFRELIRPVSLSGKSYLSPASLRYFWNFYPHQSEGVWKGGDSENLEEIRVRSANAKRILENLPGKNIVVVSHCFFMDVFAETVCNQRLPTIRRLLYRLIGRDKIPNTGIFHFTYNPQTNDKQCAWESVEVINPPYVKITNNK